MSTLTEEIAPVAPAKHRAEVATALPPARGQSFLKLVTIELRKSVNTRSGRVLIGAILLIALAAMTWQFTHLPEGAAGVDGFLGAGSTGAMLILPVIGVMAMTSEWTQRTALTTFTLSPRRVRVQLAKFVSAVVLSAVVMTGVVLLALLGTALAGAVTDHSATYAGLGGLLASSYLMMALNVVMGAAFGAVIAQTAVAILVFFIAPTAWSLAGPALFKDNANYLDVFSAFGRIAERDLNGMLPETLTAIGVWVVLPTIVGLWLSSRREVK
ncbi:ABC transporter permease [Kribbella sandramycini]|uniref:ABC transporter permease n=1 Tax=Kribbella sandramycini TaxID=60450 RepID=A0A7Y4L670_9ACTN|nr:ABC transporter permease [Kribbella sandramycini]MBB6566150.1 ABC-type transport system involved in multi-copper enzyme maturation permease subunit [Kribbella sandramycini]NOL45150.1 ABC transporter permease [Kribbella sandramycini]